MQARQGRRFFHSVLTFLAILAIPFMVAGSLLWGPEEEETAEIGLQMILVRSPAEAQEVLARLRRGEDFGQVAKKHSIDATRANGGYLGKVQVRDLRPELRNALRGVQPGRLSEVIETPAGLMILRILTEGEMLEIEMLETEDGMLEIEMLETAGMGGPGRMANDVSGSLVTDHAFRSIKKPPGWDQDLQTICEMKIVAVRTAFWQLEENTATPKSGVGEQRDVKALFRDYHNLAQLWAYQGNLEQTVKYLQAAHGEALSLGDKEVLLELEEKLGIAYLRWGEIENSVHTAHVKSCLFPMEGRGPLKGTAGWESAIKHFQRFLEEKPEDLEVKWLLNLAYMALGRYPDGVPKQYLIPLGPFESKQDVGQFVDVAPCAGLDTFNMAGGAIVDDFDQDGFLDVVTSTLDPCASLRYMHNTGRGAFTDRTAQAGLANQLGGLNMNQADYNNDGCTDILVLRGAWQVPMRNSLLRNNCDGTFTDVTRESGLAVPATKTQTAAWADIENDGDLDLFVGNESAASQLFLNKGDGTFVDIAAAAGVNRVGFTKGVTAGDYDNDGYPDFYVSNFRGDNFLYHNNSGPDLHRAGQVLACGKAPQQLSSLVL